MNLFILPTNLINIVTLYFGDVIVEDEYKNIHYLTQEEFIKFKNPISVYIINFTIDDKTVFQKSIKYLWGIPKIKTTNLSSMFCSSNLIDGNISQWDVSSVTNMCYMFYQSKFNSKVNNISQWDVSSVTDMCGMFYQSEFNNDISQWDVSSVTNMCYMFFKSEFNNDISQWDVSSVTNMFGMFYKSEFNNDISQWDVSSVTNMHYMFQLNYKN